MPGVWGGAPLGSVRQQAGGLGRSPIGYHAEAPVVSRRDPGGSGGVSQLASALALSESNSACVMAPESSSFFADSISAVGDDDDEPATCRM